VDIEGRDGQLLQAKMNSRAGGIARLGYGSTTKEFQAAKGATLIWNGR
jgi:hypothetical protein